MNPYEKSRAHFNSYAGLDAPNLPPNFLSALQVKLYRWTQTHVPKHTLPPSVENALGAVEEMGELFENRAMVGIGRLAHLELNISQGRRYSKLTEEEQRAKKADAIADAVVFLMNACTASRLDFGTLVADTIREVTERDWVKNPETAATPPLKHSGEDAPENHTKECNEAEDDGCPGNCKDRAEAQAFFHTPRGG